MKILIAEDNLLNLRLAIKLLEKFGYQADAVSNGAETVNVLKKNRYGLIFMDIQKPEIDGLEATRIIQDGGAGESNIMFQSLP